MSVTGCDMLSDCSELYCVTYSIDGLLNNLISLVPDGPLQPPPPPAPVPSPAPSQNTVPTAAPPPNPPQNPPNGQGGQQQQQPLNPAIIGKAMYNTRLITFWSPPIGNLQGTPLDPYVTCQSSEMGTSYVTMIFRPLSCN